MKNLEQFTTKEVVDYYIGYIMEHDLASSKSQARQLLRDRPKLCVNLPRGVE